MKKEKKYSRLINKYFYERYQNKNSPNIFNINHKYKKINPTKKYLSQTSIPRQNEYYNNKKNKLLNSTDNLIDPNEHSCSSERINMCIKNINKMKNNLTLHGKILPQTSNCSLISDISFKTDRNHIPNIKLQKNNIERIQPISVCINSNIYNEYHNKTLIINKTPIKKKNLVKKHKNKLNSQENIILNSSKYFPLEKRISPKTKRNDNQIYQKKKINKNNRNNLCKILDKKVSQYNKNILNKVRNRKISDEEKNKYIIRIQKIYRGYLIRKKLYMNLFIYTRYLKAVNTLKKFLSLHKKKILFQYFMKKPKKVANRKNINLNRVEKKLLNIQRENKKLKNENLMYKDIKNQFEKVIKENDEIKNTNIDIIKQNNQLLEEIQSLKEAYKSLFQKEKSTPVDENNKKITETKNKELSEKINNNQKNSPPLQKINNDKKDNNINDQNKENEKKLEINNLLKKQRKLVEIVERKIFKIKDYLHKYFLKFYYNGVLEIKDKCAVTENINNDDSKNSQNNINNNSQINEKNNENLEIKEYNLKELNLSEEELKERQKIKKIKDLFYNKVRERKHYLQKCFQKFYYNGIFTQMKKQIISEKQTENLINTDDKNPNTNINNNNQQSGIIENNNIQKEKKEENMKKEDIDRLKKARNFRNLIRKKTKASLEILRKYFYKFYLSSLVSKIKENSKNKRSSAILLSPSTKGINEIPKHFNKKNSVMGLENIMKNLNEMKLKQDNNNETEEKIKKILQKFVSKIDRNNQIILKNSFEIYNLKSKLLSFKELNLLNAPKKTKKKKRKHKSCEITDRLLQKNEGQDNENKIEELPMIYKKITAEI